ncbi:MAG TPA: hypothetical protein PLK59_09165, partial [Synergistales bacterium]|nr:hypothetical protein [Synergistales bacterium]
WEMITIETQRETNCCEGQGQNPRPRQKILHRRGHRGEQERKPNILFKSKTQSQSQFFPPQSTQRKERERNELL